MIRLQQHTGMRPGEVCCITPAMIDRDGPVWTANLPMHKTAWRGHDRTIYLGPLAQAVLLPYLLRAGDAAIFSPAEADQQRRDKLRAGRTTPMSCGNKPGSNRAKNPKKSPGTQYRTQSYGKAIGYACSKAFPNPDGSTPKQAAAWRAKYWWSPNQLRHAVATKIRKQHGLEAAQVILGHSNLSITQVYAEADRARGVEVAAMVG